MGSEMCIRDRSKSLSIEVDARIREYQKVRELAPELLQLERIKSVDESVYHATNRVIDRLFNSEVEKQVVREHIASLLMEELSNIEIDNSSDKEDNEEISNDWLNLFWTCVENKTDVDLQRIFAKILAGECVKPGCFSARLLHILSVMNKKDAIAFQAVCALAIHDESGIYLIEPVEEYQNFLHESLKDQLKYDQYVVEDLESLGLLARSSILTFYAEDHGQEKVIADTKVKIEIENTELLEDNQPYINGIPLTKPAVELLSIIHVKLEEKYFSALSKYLREYVGIKLTKNS